MDMSQVEQSPQTNGMSDIEEEEKAKMRPVDIDADVREMERRKRVEMIMNSKLFREELERIIESQLKDGSGPSGLLQQISDMVGVSRQGGNVFKSSNCVIPVNDIRGIEAMGYAKGEKILRCKLACLYRLIDLYGWAYGSSTLITARLNQDDEQFLVNPYGMLFHEVTASSLIKVDMQGGVIEQGTTNFSVNISAFSLHAAVHSARPDIKCIIHVHTPAVIAVSSLKQGLMPLSQESVVMGDVSAHYYLGGHLDSEEKDRIARNLGPINKVLLLTNQGALCCGETIEEAFYNARNTVLASEIQLKLMPVGVDNLVVMTDEIKKRIYDAAHKPPESTPRPDQPSILEGKVERKWRVGGVEFEALMRMLDNAGFRTGYIYRHPLVKGEPPKPKNDVEVPPAVSSLGYLLEEEELYRQGLWRKLEGGRKGNDRSRWLNSPNTYQKVEILETGTADPKKITKWVAEGSPNHSSSTAVRIESALQFVPKGTNPKEFKQRQQQIKDYRRADKISAGPQSHILEGVTWEEAKKMQDATVTQTGDHVVLMGAASKGIIQRGHQHNAMVYKSPYAKNPFDSVTDEELIEYKMVVEKKTKGEYDTDFSESEGLSSAALNKRIDDIHIRSPTSITSETEEESHDEPQILRIETKTVPRASQPEVVLSDGDKSGKRRPYRTNSHAGFPKGSYLEPNPFHFHLIRNNELAIHRPVTFSHASSSYYFHRNQPSPFRINIQNSNSLSVNIPIETLRGFIIPFASALQLRNFPISSNQECQTSYMNSVNYTSAYVKHKTDSPEKQILNEIKQHIFEEFSSSESEYDLDNNLNEIVEFNENHQVRNESFLELTPDILAMLPSTENSSDVSENDNDNNAVTLLKEADGFVGKLQEFTGASFDLADGVLNEAKDILLSLDEGIEDCTLINNTCLDIHNETISDAVKNMADLLMEYLIQQCLEVKEIILCPEILHDPNLYKLLEKLKKIYKEYFESSLNGEQKNEFRISLASVVLNRLEAESSGDSMDSNTISDKIFTISELLNDILDTFFDSLETKNRFQAGEIFHSTPEPSKKQHNEPNVVTTFHQKSLTKSGSELYWMSLSPKKVVKNLFDTNKSSLKETFRIPQENVLLSPISEESRLNLFNSCLTDEELSSVICLENDNSSPTLRENTNAILNKNIINNNVNFCRRRDVRSSAYVNKKVVLFTNTCENKENESLDNSGNWLGYDEAKF